MLHDVSAILAYEHPEVIFLFCTQLKALDPGMLTQPKTLLSQAGATCSCNISSHTRFTCASTARSAAEAYQSHAPPPYKHCTQHGAHAPLSSRGLRVSYTGVQQADKSRSNDLPLTFDLRARKPKQEA